MSNTHIVRLEVTYEMYEMDGTPEASAEIALGLIYETLSNTLAGDVQVVATHWHEAQDLDTN